MILMPREALLARTLVELADNLVEDFDVVELLTLLTDRCVEVLDVSAAGIMLADPDRHLAVMAYSSDAMRLLELFELQSQEGPCVDSFRTGAPVLNQDLAEAEAEQRWPQFAPRARRAGFDSVHALPLRLRHATIGALNLFRSGTGCLDDADASAGQALADVATITILQHRAALEAHVVNQQLTQALASRVIIEQAKGVVAEASGLDMQEAFERLRLHARRHNRRLTDVARSIVEDRSLVADLEPPSR
jgi:GAF domain-containing protein